MMQKISNSHTRGARSPQRKAAAGTPRSLFLLGLALQVPLVLALGVPVPAQEEAALPETNLQAVGARVREWMKSPAPKTRSAGNLGLGLVPSDEEELKKQATFRVLPMRSQRPASLLLTDYLPPAGNQGVQGSCVAWSAAYAVYSYGVGVNQRKDAKAMAEPSAQFSPAFIYNLRENAAQGDAGMQFSDAFRTLREYGCVTLKDFPYNAADSKTKPSAELMTKAARYRARDVGLLFSGPLRGGPPVDLERLRCFLADTRQPFVTGVPIFQDFENLRGVDENYVYSPSNPDKKAFRGLHAVVINGYDDSKKAFHLVNSWGEGWGYKGGVWVDQEFLKQLTVEGWGVVVGGWRYMSPDHKFVSLKRKTP